MSAYTCGPPSQTTAVVSTLVWGFVYGATAMSASALPLAALIPQLPVLGDVGWIADMPFIV